MAESFHKGSQTGWYHDQGHWGGYFHTYDHLQVEGEPRQVHIFLPRSYEVSAERYPVLYVNDGNTAFFPGGAYQKTWNMAQILTKLYLSNQIRKIIVVAVAPLNRDYEYTHAPVWGKEWGGLDKYAQYLAHNLKSFIDSNYRTLSAPENNLILGASHGGLAAFYTALKYPQQFGILAAMSPSFWVGLDAALDLTMLQLGGTFWGSLESSVLLEEATPTLQDPGKRPRIYLDWGLVRDEGFHNAFIEERATARGREMRDILIRNFGYSEGDNLFVFEDPLGQHWEESWSARLEYVLKLFFGF